MTEKTYTVAGTSKFNGSTKVRFANDFVGRFKILTKNKHENIELVEFGSSMSKADICKALLAHDKFQSEEQQSAITEFVVRNIKSKQEAPKSESKVTSTDEVSADVLTEAQPS